MPTLESNRRIIGRGIVQLYVTDDNEETPEDTKRLNNTSEFPISGNIGESYVINDIKYVIRLIKEV